MKKIVFTAQVFGLIAAFPIVVALEMNHVKGNLRENKPTSGVTKRLENIMSPSSANYKGQKDNALFDMNLNKRLLKVTF